MKSRSLVLGSKAPVEAEPNTSSFLIWNSRKRFAMACLLSEISEIIVAAFLRYET